MEAKTKCCLEGKEVLPAIGGKRMAIKPRKISEEHILSLVLLIEVSAL